MEIRRRAFQLGVFASAGLFAACGADEPEPVNEAPAPAPAAPAGGAVGAAVPIPANLPAGVTADMIQQGQQIFVSNGICFTCHGQNAQGTPLAPDLTDDQWLWVTPGADMYEQLVQQITGGTPQPKEYPAPMPPKGGAQLDESQLRAVAAYVYALSQS